MIRQFEFINPFRGIPIICDRRPQTVPTSSNRTLGRFLIYMYIAKFKGGGGGGGNLFLEKKKKEKKRIN